MIPPRLLQHLDQGLRGSKRRGHTNDPQASPQGYGRFVGTADLPPSDFMPEMMQLYPDAKVILVRRDPVKWWNSIAALTSRTTPSWLGFVLAPIPGWRYLAEFANHYSQSTLHLAGVPDYHTASPVELINKGGPRRCSLYKSWNQIRYETCILIQSSALRPVQIFSRLIMTKFELSSLRSNSSRWI